MTLYYDDNTASDYSLIMDAPFNVEYQNGSTATDGVYAQDPIMRSLSSWYDEGTGTPYIAVTGLTVASTYKFTFFGSRTSFTAEARYTISGGTSEDGTYVDLDCNSNYLNTVSVSNISPSSSGKIGFWTYWENNQAVLNVLEIEEGS